MPGNYGSGIGLGTYLNTLETLIDAMENLLNRARVAVAASANQAGLDSEDGKLLKEINEALKDYDERTELYKVLSGE